MNLIKLFICYVLISGCRNTANQEIRIRGKAEHVKEGAIVISNDNKEGYYVEGLHSWEHNIIGKTVEVTGVLEIENYTAPKKGEDIKQQVIGIKRIIQKPRWKLIK